MTPGAQIALWGLAAMAPLLLNLITRSRADAVGLAFMLLAGWLLGRIIAALAAPPESMQWYPLVDAVAGALTFRCWQKRPEAWKLVVTFLLIGQCTLHASFWLSGPAPGALTLYLVANNTLFALQLLTVASPGGRRVARLLLPRLSDLAGGHRHPRAGSS